MKPAKLTENQKRAIENLIILADYIKEHSVYSGEMKKLIDESIKIGESMIGRVDLDKDFQEERKAIVEEIKNKFKP